MKAYSWRFVGIGAGALFLFSTAAHARGEQLPTAVGSVGGVEEVAAVAEEAASDVLEGSAYSCVAVITQSSAEGRTGRSLRVTHFTLPLERPTSGCGGSKERINEYLAWRPTANCEGVEIAFAYDAGMISNHPRDALASFPWPRRGEAYRQEMALAFSTSDEGSGSCGMPATRLVVNCVAPGSDAMASDVLNELLEPNTCVVMDDQGSVSSGPRTRICRPGLSRRAVATPGPVTDVPMGCGAPVERRVRSRIRTSCALADAGGGGDSEGFSEGFTEGFGETGDSEGFTEGYASEGAVGEAPGVEGITEGAPDDGRSRSRSCPLASEFPTVIDRERGGTEPELPPIADPMRHIEDGGDSATGDASSAG